MTRIKMGRTCDCAHPQTPSTEGRPSRVVAGWLRWPLWSWGNLAVTVLAALAMTAFVGRLTGGPEAGGSASPVRATGHVSSASSSATGATAAVPSGHPTVTGSPALSATPTSLTNPTDIATEYLTAWARPELPADEWRTALEPLTTPTLQASMRYADPARVPATKVYQPRGSATVAGDSATVQVSTNAGTIEVALRRVDGRWLVDDLRPADNAPPAPAISQPATPGGG